MKTRSSIIGLIRAALAGATLLFTAGPAANGETLVPAGKLFDQGWIAYRTQHYQEAMRLFRSAADEGNLQAEFWIGSMYEAGLGVPEDMAQAMIWFRKAADRGLPAAQTAIGTLYANGWGVPQNYAEALTWHRKAAEQGYAGAQTSVGIAYVNGLGVQSDFAQARIWLDKAIEGGDGTAELYLCPPYQAAWIDAFMSKDVERMDRVINKIDPHCSDLLREAKAARGSPGH